MTLRTEKFLIIGFVFTLVVFLIILFIWLQCAHNVIVQKCHKNFPDTTYVGDDGTCYKEIGKIE